MKTPGTGGGMDPDSRWELGSEFHWAGFPPGPFLPWPRPHAWFGRGRDALLAVWQAEGWGERPLWAPAYFCPDVAACWERAGLKVRRYVEDPRRPEPDWGTLDPDRGDVVLAVNLFGVREGAAWRSWQRDHPGVVLVEDHSHDPLSRWALESEAEFALASVRKTFPVPDGGLLWSPRGRPLPPEPAHPEWEGSALKLAGMIWKAEYLAGRGEAAPTKAAYRHFQVQGERALSESRSPGLAPWSRSLLSRGLPEGWRRRREENARLLLDLLREAPGVRPLFGDWSPGHCPFSVVLEFPSEDACSRCHEHLAARGIYTAVHWRLGPEAQADLQYLSRRVRSIPVDQRYGPADMERVAAVVRELPPW